MRSLESILVEKGRWLHQGMEPLCRAIASVLLIPEYFVDASRVRPRVWREHESADSNGGFRIVIQRTAKTQPRILCIITCFPFMAHIVIHEGKLIIDPRIHTVHTVGPSQDPSALKEDLVGALRKWISPEIRIERTTFCGCCIGYRLLKNDEVIFEASPPKWFSACIRRVARSSPTENER